MIIFHIDSGLGNQMLAYCEYLALKVNNPDQDVFIETLVYEIPECNEVISQWNGFELERIFNLKIPNLKELLGKEKYDIVKNRLIESHFWNKNWNYSPYLVDALKEVGINVENGCALRCETPAGKSFYTKLMKRKESRLISYFFHRMMQILKEKSYVKKYDDKQHLFGKYSNILLEQRFSFIYRNNGIETIKHEIMQSFTFLPFIDEKNIKVAKEIQSCNSVAIHARRGDMLVRSGVYYEGGYFRRAISYVKKKVENPVFYFFCDPGSAEWCNDNLDMFGIKLGDPVRFVTWNKSVDSYRDMQLMSLCKHNIVTISSFGWWGAYLNQNPHKITCTPDWAYNSTNHF